MYLIIRAKSIKSLIIIILVKTGDWYDVINNHREALWRYPADPHSQYVLDY